MNPKKAVPRKSVLTNPIESAHYVTHADLVRIAKKNHCAGIHTEPVLTLCRPADNFWVFKATVYKSARCSGFIGFGDAHPGNVSPLIFNQSSTMPNCEWPRPGRSTGPCARPTGLPSVLSRSCHPGPCHRNKS